MSSLGGGREPSVVIKCVKYTQKQRRHRYSLESTTPGPCPVYSNFPPQKPFQAEHRLQAHFRTHLRRVLIEHNHDYRFHHTEQADGPSIASFTLCISKVPSCSKSPYSPQMGMSIPRTHISFMWNPLLSFWFLTPFFLLRVIVLTSSLIS